MLPTKCIKNTDTALGSHFRSWQLESYLRIAGILLFELSTNSKSERIKQLIAQLSWGRELDEAKVEHIEMKI